MINGIGVVGWGVGGIEAEAGMLGQPVYFLTPDVVGVHLKGKLRGGVTATDLVLTITEMLRKAKVVGKFVEFFGEGVENLAVPDRATIANMAPEYGATMGFFPVDGATVEYFQGTGRTAGRGRGLQGVLQGPGPVRHPQGGPDRLQPDAGARSRQRRAFARRAQAPAGPYRDRQGQVARSPSLFSKPVAENGFSKKPEDLPRRFTTRDGIDIGSGDVLIAAITSCTNTSNPSVLLAAGSAREEGGGERPVGASRTSRPRSRRARAW